MSMSTTAAESSPGFAGYRRADGRAGVRNHLALISTVALANRIAELSAARFDASQAPGNDPVLLVRGEFQRGLQTQDAVLQDEVLFRLITHPNIGAAVVLCHDRSTAHRWAQRLASGPTPVRVLAVMDHHGIHDAITQTVTALGQLASLLQPMQRAWCPFSELTFALECGGSDASSAVCSNPAIGRFVDRAVALGASVIVSETAEFIGGEDVVRAQSANPDIARRIIERIALTESRMTRDGDRYRGTNPTAENIEAGLTTLIEKTMGALCKIGRAPFVDCLDFGQAPSQPGLSFMDTPFFSPCSITGMVAAGAQITLFSMGVFNPSGNPLAPTIKVCGNPDTVRRWSDGIDVALVDLIEGRINLDQAGDRVFTAVLEVAGGARPHTESWGEGQFIIPRLLPTF
jgi:altronate dehydratase large subunit